MSFVVGAIDAVARESMILASIGFLIGGIDDLAVDAVYWLGALWRRRAPPVTELPAGIAGRLAIFVPAWDEAAVIGAMLRTTLARFGDDDFRIYVGVYPNDRATIDAVAAIAERDTRVRITINPSPGSTTKADCLNVLWDALRREESREGWRAAAVVFHDAEDVVHRDELRAIRGLLVKHEVVQLPVRPLVDPRSPLVAGHYIDEFASAHGRDLVVRQALGAPIPLAGVGFAIDRDMLVRVAAQRGGAPFDADSLTEDYELGLMTAALGARQIFARIRDADGKLIAVAEHFPDTVGGAIRQKARWMVGIALDGWDRIGWGPAGDWRDHWMRMRDRRAPIAMLMLLIAYVALIVWGLSVAAHTIVGTPTPQPGPAIMALLKVNAAMLGWRLMMRVWFTGLGYGGWQALLSLPRILVGNYIALMSARRALSCYIGALRGRPPGWDKTAHRFPKVSP